MEKIDSLSHQNSKLVQQLEDALVSEQNLRLKLGQSSTTNPSESEKLNILRNKVQQLESSLKEMSESHLEQLEVIREGRNKALEACETTYEIKLEAITAQFNTEKQSLLNEIENLKKIVADKEFFFKEKCQEFAELQSRFEALSDQTSLAQAEKTNLGIQLKNLKSVEISLSNEIEQVKISQIFQLILV